ncbi:MAG: hypothetical protein MK209_07730 [Planctomycetes bacterium]|nr:hypothetical protein [Planctomycetota bacterium]
MNRSTLPFAGLALLIVALAVSLWPSVPAEDGLGAISEASSEEEERAEAVASKAPEEGEAQREELDPGLMGIEDALIVTVIDEFKRPVSDVTVAVTSKGELPIWIYDLGRKTDASGRAIFDRAKGIEICEEGGWEEVVIGVWDWKLRGFKVEKTIRLEDHSAMTFELPGVQQILVKLSGFPDGMAPVLSPVEGSPNDVMEITGIQQADGWWRFDEPPLGEVWDLWYARVILEEGSGLAIPQRMIDIPGEIQFVGPGVPGEITRAESDLMDQPVAQGTLVDEDGKPFQIGRREQYLELRGISDTGKLELQPFQFEYFNKGQFLAWPTGQRELGEFAEIAELLVATGYIDEAQLPEEKRPMELHQIVSLYFTWLPEMSRRGGITSERMGTARDAMVLMPMGQPGVKLGDVVLSSENYLTKFVVVNEAGEPIPDADIELEFVATGEPRGLSSTFLPELETNAQGHAWLMAPNWEMVQRTARGMTKRGRPDFTGLRVEVTSRDYIDFDEVMPMGLRDIAVTLKGGGSVIGDVAFSRGVYDYFRVRAYMPGAVFNTEEDLRSDGISPRGRGRDTFRLRQLPEGVVDVVVHWGRSQSWPVYAERGISVSAGKETKLTSLEASPFEQSLRWVEIAAPEGDRRGLEAFVTHDAGQGVRYDGRVDERGGVWRIPIPLGSNRLQGVIAAPGFEPVQMIGLGPGRHELDFKGLRKITLAPTCGVGGYGSWWIGVDGDGTQVASLDRATGQIVLRVAGPDSLTLTWNRRNGWSVEPVGQTKLVITEDDFARGQIKIDPPPGW